MQSPLCSCLVSVLQLYCISPEAVDTSVSEYAFAHPYTNQKSASVTHTGADFFKFIKKFAQKCKKAILVFSLSARCCPICEKLQFLRNISYN